MNAKPEVVAIATMNVSAAWGALQRLVQGSPNPWKAAAADGEFRQTSMPLYSEGITSLKAPTKSQAQLWQLVIS